MTAPLDLEPSPSGAVAVEAAGLGLPPAAIEGRSLGQIAWMRLKRDKVALVAGGIIVFLVVVAVIAPLLAKLEGSGPNEQHLELLNNDLGGIPNGKFGGVSGSHWFGIEPVLARDIFARLVYGSRVSLLIAMLATGISILFGVVLGITSGYFGKWIDASISRVMDVLLAFPQLLFTIALISIVPATLLGISGSGLRIGVLVIVIGFFGWPYIGRIVRGQTISLREREFVDAAKSIGAGSGHIIFRQLLPNLWAPILVYATLIIPANILAEAALSFLGVGVQSPTSSWGQMLSDASRYFQVDPTYLAVPGIALFVTVLAFNLLGDGLRDALDPRAGR